MTVATVISSTVLLAVCRQASSRRDLTEFHVGSFTIKTQPVRRQLSVLFDSKQVARLPFGWLNCDPVVAEGFVILPVFDELICMDSKGGQRWSKQLTFLFNPSALVAVGDIVVCDEGPRSLGVRSEYGSHKALYAAAQAAWRTIGLNVRTGKEVWNHQHGYAGIPLVALDAHTVLCASILRSLAHSFDGRELVLNELRKDGRRTICWRTPIRARRSLYQLYEDLALSGASLKVTRRGRNLVVAPKVDSRKTSNIIMTVSSRRITIVDGTLKVAFRPVAMN